MMLEELFSEIKSMISLGNKSDALDLLEANYEAVKEQMVAGRKSIEEAAILDVIALGYMAIEDFKMVDIIMNMVGTTLFFITKKHFFYLSIYLTIYFSSKTLVK